MSVRAYLVFESFATLSATVSFEKWQDFFGWFFFWGGVGWGSTGCGACVIVYVCFYAEVAGNLVKDVVLF